MTLHDRFAAWVPGLVLMAVFIAAMFADALGNTITTWLRGLLN